ncbi:MAG: SH3 domain-containing protein [Acidobacteriota bacterium]
MKKIKTIILFFTLMILCASLSIIAQEKYIRIVTDNVNVRSGPSVENSVLWVAHSGDVYQLLERIDDWYKICLPEDKTKIGYVFARLAVPVEEEKLEEEKPEVKEKVKEEVKEPVFQPPVREAKKEGRKGFFVFFTGGYNINSISFKDEWQFFHDQEYGPFSGAYEGSPGAIFEAGAGFKFTPSLGIFVSYEPFSGKNSGDFSAGIPHPFYFNKHRNMSWENKSIKYTESAINFDFIFSLNPQSTISFSLFAGGTYFNVSTELVDKFYWSQSYPYDSVTYSSSEMKSYSVSPFGFNGGVVIDIFFIENVALNIIAKYTVGSASIKTESGSEITFNAGGARGGVGLKVIF